MSDLAVKRAYIRLVLTPRVKKGRGGSEVGLVLALIISTVFEQLQWQTDLIIGLPILIIGAILVINQKY